MDKLAPDIESLLQALRSHLANSNDPWEQRRTLMLKINEMIPGGEADLFVGTIREMSRVGASYAAMMQTFGQFYAGQQTGANFAEMMSRNFGANPFSAGSVPPNSLDFFKQMGDLMAVQAKPFNKPEDK